MPQLSSSQAVKSTPVVTMVQALGAAVGSGVTLATVSPTVTLPTRHATSIVGLVQNNCASQITVRLRLWSAGRVLFHNGAATNIAAGATGTILYANVTEPILDFAELLVTHAGAGGTLDVALYARS